MFWPGEIIVKDPFVIKYKVAIYVSLSIKSELTIIFLNLQKSISQIYI
jgi:hypothetical protein